jgi:heat shock protein HslJ
VLLGGAALVTGCGQDATTISPGDQPSNPDLRGSTYLSTAVTRSGEPHKLVPGTRISLQFTDDGRLLVNAGCNTMQGPVDTSDGVIRLDGALAVTEMGCDPPRHEQDQWIADLLQAEPTWQLRGQQLVIASDETTITLLDRKAAEPDRELTKTRWTLDTIIEGDVASSVPAGVRTPEVRFTDGEVGGFNGCNQFGGKARVTNDTIRFGSIISTQIACEQPAADVERSVMGVLDGEVSYRIEGRRLTLEHPSGRGLVFTAQPNRSGR